MPVIEQQFLSTIQWLMEKGALDSSYATSIVTVQFINGTDNNNELENAINDDDYNNYNDSSSKNINSFIFFLLSGKMLIGLSIIAIFLALLLVKRYRSHRHYYMERDKSLQDTESSSGDGLHSFFGIKGGSSNDSTGRFNNWRPSSGDAFVRPDDDDLVSCLSLQLEKSFANGAVGNAPAPNPNSSFAPPPPPKFLSLRRLLSFKKEMKRGQSFNSEGLTTLSSIWQTGGDGSSKKDVEQQRQQQGGCNYTCSEGVELAAENTCTQNHDSTENICSYAQHPDLAGMKVNHMTQESPEFNIHTKTHDGGEEFHQKEDIWAKVRLLFFISLQFCIKRRTKNSLLHSFYFPFFYQY